MPFWAWIKRTEHQVPWGWLSGLIGASALGFAVYTTYHEKKPDVAMEVVSEANVLDVHTPLPDLTVLFRGQDIQKSSLNLRLFQLAVSNDGAVDITQTLFDATEPWGFRVRDGHAIEIRLSNASSDYLRSHINPVLVDDSTIRFSKVILERGASFLVELLVLHNKGSEPQLIPLGKIAGIDNTRVTKRQAAASEMSFWRKVVQGSVWVHLVRFVGYIVLFLGVLALFAWLGTASAERKQNRREALKREELSPALAELAVEPHAKASVLDIYAIAGRRGLESALYQAAHPARLRQMIQIPERRHSLYHDWREELRVAMDGVIMPDQPARAYTAGFFYRRNPIGPAIRKMMIAEGFAKLSDGVVVIEPDFTRALEFAKTVATALEDGAKRRSPVR